MAAVPAHSPCINYLYAKKYGTTSEIGLHDSALTETIDDAPHSVQSNPVVQHLVPEFLSRDRDVIQEHPGASPASILPACFIYGACCKRVNAIRYPVLFFPTCRARSRRRARI